MLSSLSSTTPVTSKLSNFSRSNLPVSQTTCWAGPPVFSRVISLRTFIFLAEFINVIYKFKLVVVGTNYFPLLPERFIAACLSVSS